MDATKNHSNHGRRLARGVVCVALVPSFVLVDFAVAYLRGWRVESHVERAILLAAGAVLVAVIVASRIPSGRALLADPRLVLATSGAAVAWLVAELTIGAFVRPADSFRRFHLDTPGAEFICRPDPRIMPGVSGEARTTTNELGLRATPVPPRDRARRILCVGGSTTICQYLDDAETWPHLLMERMNAADPSAPVWVGNAGKNGYSTPDHVAFLEQLEWLPTMDTVLFLVGVNDLSTGLVHKRPRVRNGLPPLWRRSPVVNLVARLAQMRSARAELQVEDEAGQVYEPRRMLRRSSRVSDTLPDVAAELRAFDGRIRRLVELVRAAGATPVFVAQPVLWDRDLSAAAAALLWFGRLPDGSFLSAPALRQGMDLYNDRVAATCRELGVDFVDVSGMSGQAAFFYDDCHLSEAGAKELARRIAEHWSAEPTPDH